MKAKKMKGGLVIFLFLISLSVFAEMDIESRVSQLENQMLQVSAKNAMGTYGATMAPTHTEQKCCMFGEVLRWCARMGGTEFVFLHHIPPIPQNVYPLKGSMQFIKHPFNWGIRGGITCDLGCDTWNAICRYTYFSTKGSKSLSMEINKSDLIPVQVAMVIMRGEDDAKFICMQTNSQNELNYYVLDVELKRGSFVGDSLALYPHFGIKAARIERDQHTCYDSRANIWAHFALSNKELGELVMRRIRGEEVVDRSSIYTVDRCCFKGIGLGLGMDSDWHLSAEWSLYGNISGGLLFGHYRLNHHAWWDYKEDDRIELVENRHCLIPSLQMQCGVRFARYNKKYTQYIAFNCGFETNYWWRQSQSVFTIQARKSKENLVWRSEDLGLFGFLIGFRWGF